MKFIRPECAGSLAIIDRVDAVDDLSAVGIVADQTGSIRTLGYIWNRYAVEGDMKELSRLIRAQMY